MKRLFHQIFWCICCYMTVNAQKSVSGVVLLQGLSNFSGVEVSIEGSRSSTITNKLGAFWLQVESNNSEVLKIERTGFYSQRIPVSFTADSVHVGEIILKPIAGSNAEVHTIVLTDDDLLGNTERTDFTAGLFQYSRDEYLKAAAYNFSQTWFKLRGVDAAYSSFLINGVEMNKFSNNRPLWSNWGGLNDAFKNRSGSNGMEWSDHAFGNVLGVSSISTRASEFRPFSKISLASTNRSYRGRIMASHASGLNENGWAYVVSGSGRYADEGFLEGTPYQSWSAFLAVEKQFDTRNSLNFTGFVSSNIRGKSSPNTDEVYKLRNYKYNSYWGYQNGKQRNSRIREIMEPVLMLTYDYKGVNSKLAATISYQFGHIFNSRLGYYKAENPDPTYYKKLPSYYLSDVEQPDYANAYLAARELQTDGQVAWEKLYEANAVNKASVYYLYNDVNSDTSFNLSVLYDYKLNEEKRWLSGFRHRQMNSKNYAQMTDLMGGAYFIDLNQYGEGNGVQNDLNNPNREVFEGEKFQYNYELAAQESKLFTQFESLQPKVEYFLALEGVFFNSQRIGNYQNGSYQNNSFGPSKAISFSGFSFKGGGTYKYNGRNLITLHAGVLSRIPPLQSIYANQRVSNKLIPAIEVETIVSGDLSYRYRSSKFQGRVTGYFLNFRKGIESSFFFAQGILGSEADFVHEIITGVEKQNIGVEWSLSYQLTDNVKLFGAGTFAQYLYTNNPNLLLESESFPLENNAFGNAYLKNVRQGNTPQRAYSIGFEYRDNDFWWMQVNANYLSHNYLDVSPFLRSENFYKDDQGVPFINAETGKTVTNEEVEELLKQEVFDPVFLVNLVGGKSWKLGDAYTGFFMVVNNVLGAVFRSGGFEQGRKANYPELKRDKSLDTPLFGPKYWYTSGASYYLNMYYRF